MPDSKGLAGGSPVPLFLLPLKYLLSQGVPFFPVPWLHTLTRIPENLCTGPLTPACLLETFLWSPSACGNLTQVSLATGMVSKREGQQERTLTVYSWYEFPKEGFSVESPLGPGGCQSFMLIPSLILLGLTTLAINSLGSVTPRDPKESCSYYFSPPNLTYLAYSTDGKASPWSYVLNTLDVQYSRICT